MTQVRRSDSTKNLMAILTVIVGVVVGYLVIEGATESAPPLSSASNEVKGAVSMGGSNAPDEPGRIVLQASESTTQLALDAGASHATASAVESRETPQAATSTEPPVESASADQETPASPGTADPVVAAAEAQLELAPPAAVAAEGAGVAGDEATPLSAPDRLVLSADDTTIVARRYVDEPPVVEPEKGGLKLATKFASATRIVPFAFNRVGMGPEGEAAVRELVPIAMKAEKVHVRGRTDAKGAFDINRQVALERAYTVREKFVEAGVPGEKLGISYCTECFIATNETEAGRRANRRVDVEFIMPAEDIDSIPETTYARPLPETARKLSFARSLGSMDRDESN